MVSCVKSVKCFSLHVESFPMESIHFDPTYHVFLALSATIVVFDMFHHCGGDMSWSASAWNAHCMDRSSWEWEYGHCCMVYVLAGQHTIAQLQSRSGGCKITNATYQGVLHADCLRKRYPCLNYLFYKDRELIQDLLDEYSDVIPDQPGKVKLTPEQFDSMYAEVEHVIPMKLVEGESFDNMIPIMERLAKEHNIELDLNASLATPPPAKEIPRDMSMPRRSRCWVYLLIRQWAAVEAMREFEGDPDFVLMRLWDGNLMRMRKSAIDAGLLFRQSKQRPTDKPVVSLTHILFNEIYIYHCIDGYFEWTEEMYKGGEDVRASLIPFMNPLCDKNVDWTPPTREFVEQAQAQMYESGQLSYPSDADKGDEILNFIFGGALLEAVEAKNKKTKPKGKTIKAKLNVRAPKIEISSDDSSEDGCPVLKEVPKPKTVIPSTSAHKPECCLNKAPPRIIVPERKNCRSGITGIRMQFTTRGQLWYWRIEKKIRGKQPPIYFPVRTEDPVEIERILDEVVVPRYQQHLRDHGFSESDIRVMTTPNL